MASPEKRGVKAILASSAQEKIDGMVGGIQKAVPLETDARLFVVVRDLKEAPGSVEVQARIQQRGCSDLSPRSLLYTGPSLATREVDRYIGGEDVLIYAQNSESFLKPQPLVNPAKAIEEGFQGAYNRADLIREQDRASVDPIDPDFIAGVENVQFKSLIVNRRTDEVLEGVTDTGFAYIENRAGDWDIAHSGGIVLGNNHGLDFLAESEKTGYNKPAGHFFNPDKPQDPHALATDGMYSRADWLVPPIATVVRQLKNREAKGTK